MGIFYNSNGLSLQTSISHKEVVNLRVRVVVGDNGVTNDSLVVPTKR